MLCLILASVLLQSELAVRSYLTIPQYHNTISRRVILGILVELTKLLVLVGLSTRQERCEPPFAYESPKSELRVKFPNTTTCIWFDSSLM